MSVEPWEDFEWHLNSKGICDTDQKNSSQALAIDVFGTLKTASRMERDAILSELCKRLPLPGQGPWQVELEWQDEQNRLNEHRRTQVDAVAVSRSAMVFFECKFGEADGGVCSQVTHKKQCNGNYELQTNPVNGKTAQCTLTAKGIRYWELIPTVFRFSSEQDYQPCPFNSPWYQWMRNLVLAEEIRHTEGLQTAFVIVYADQPNLPFSQKLKSKKWQEFKQTLRDDGVGLRTISYQELLAVARRATGMNCAKWQGLETWVLNKIRIVGESRLTPARD